jgi:hypothetical protein
MENTIKNDLYKINELYPGLEFYRWIPNYLSRPSNKNEIIFKELEKCKIIEICQKFEDEFIKTNIKYSFDRDGTTEIRETQVAGLLEYVYGKYSIRIPNSAIKNNSKDFIATGFAGTQFHFYKLSSYNKNVISYPSGKRIIELSGGKKSKSKK